MIEKTRIKSSFYFPSERGEVSELPPQLTSHWLVGAACATHHPSSLTVSSTHFSQRRQLMRHVQCSQIKRPTATVICHICLVAMQPNVANVALKLHASQTLAGAVSQIKRPLNLCGSLKFKVHPAQRREACIKTLKVVKMCKNCHFVILAFHLNSANEM